MNINREDGMRTELGFSGRFNIRDVIRRTDRRGRSYSRLVLSDGAGEVVALAWDGVYSGPAELRAGQTVNITGDYLPHGGKRCCKTIVVVDDPRAEKLYEQAGRRLRMMNCSLVDFPLNQFITSLVVTGPLAERFRNEPASRHHHHSYPHGLFIHSVDVALRMFGSPAIPHEDRPLAVMLGLAHDIGKAWLPEDRAVHHPGMDHDKAALIALGPAIERIQPLWPEVVNDLAQVLCLRVDRQRRPLSRRIDVLQEALRHADRISCAESWAPGSRGEPGMGDDQISVAA